MKPNIRILFMSGYTDDFIGNENSIGQDAHFIQKPLTRSDLLNKVKKAPYPVKVSSFCLLEFPRF